MNKLVSLFLFSEPSKLGTLDALHSWKIQGGDLRGVEVGRDEGLVLSFEVKDWVEDSPESLS